jgi:hypothetical protein
MMAEPQSLLDDLKRALHQAERRIAAVIVIATGALFAALHVWPPH